MFSKKSKTKRGKRSTTVVKMKKNEGLTLSKQKKKGNFQLLYLLIKLMILSLYIFLT